VQVKLGGALLYVAPLCFPNVSALSATTIHHKGTVLPTGSCLQGESQHGVGAWEQVHCLRQRKPDGPARMAGLPNRTNSNVDGVRTNIVPRPVDPDGSPSRPDDPKSFADIDFPGPRNFNLGPAQNSPSIEYLRNYE